MHALNRRSLRLLIVLLFFALLALLAACGNSVTAVSQNATAAPTPKPTQNTSVHAAVGQAITITNSSDLTVETTLVKVETSSGGEFDTPPAGQEYVIVTLHMVNKGTSSYDYNPYDFYLLSGSGNLTQETIAVSVAADTLNAGTLVAGGSVDGKLVFTATLGDHQAQLTWQPTYSSPKDQFTWKLGL